MATAFWHYPSTSTRLAWPKDSKTVLGYDFGHVTDLVDTKNGKNRFLSLEDSNLNFGIWIFLSRAQFYVLYPSNRVSRSCSHKNMPNYWGGSEHFFVTTRFRLLWSVVSVRRNRRCPVGHGGHSFISDLQIERLSGHFCWRCSQKPA